MGNELNMSYAYILLQESPYIPKDQHERNAIIQFEMEFLMKNPEATPKQIMDAVKEGMGQK